MYYKSYEPFNIHTHLYIHILTLTTLHNRNQEGKIRKVVLKRKERGQVVGESLTSIFFSFFGFNRFLRYIDGHIFPTLVH